MKQPSRAAEFYSQKNRELELRSLIEALLLRFRIAVRLAPRGSDLRRQLEDAYKDAADVAEIELRNVATLEDGAKILGSMHGREGGKAAGATKKRIAVKQWKSKVDEKKVRQWIAAGEKDIDIARRLVAVDGLPRDEETVARYIAEIRPKLTT